MCRADCCTVGPAVCHHGNVAGCIQGLPLATCVSLLGPGVFKICVRLHALVCGLLLSAACWQPS
jgi:hypothetical protein